MTLACKIATGFTMVARESPRDQLQPHFREILSSKAETGRDKRKEKGIPVSIHLYRYG